MIQESIDELEQIISKYAAWLSQLSEDEFSLKPLRVIAKLLQFPSRLLITWKWYWA